MPLTAPYEPVELSAVQQAFPADALDYMPVWEDVESWADSRDWQIQFQRDSMLLGVIDIQLIPRDKSWTQADVDRAHEHLYAIQHSFAPKHEHKEAAVAFLVDRWFTHVRWKVEGGRDEWRGHWPEELADVTMEEAEEARAQDADQEGWDHRFDSLPDEERCKVCGQPDNCGDCNHAPLTDAEATTLLRED